ncbi:hypothetical protein [Desemzia sp. FAM 23991]|uniref:hypothetical protein n=1 Tax=unclassified Desemzia TaxID=2685243 RepID=UPI0038837F57
MKVVKLLLFFTHIVVGIFAVLGGWTAVSIPESPFGISTDLLANSPFDNFFVPGILLLVAIGLGQLFSATFFFFRSRYQGYISGFFGGVLVIWLVVQVIMLQIIEPVHLITFGFAIVQLILSAVLVTKRRLLSANKGRKLVE